MALELPNDIQSITGISSPEIGGNRIEALLNSVGIHYKHTILLPTEESCFTIIYPLAVTSPTKTYYLMSQNNQLPVVEYIRFHVPKRIVPLAICSNCPLVPDKPRLWDSLIMSTVSPIRYAHNFVLLHCSYIKGSGARTKCKGQG